MTVKCKFKDGTYGFMPNIQWHPAIGTSIGHVDAAMWTFAKELNESLEEAYGKTYDDILCAEAPVEVYWHCEGDQPWKHYGLLEGNIKFIQDEVDELSTTVG